jgi:hypothetical protein
MPLAHTALIFLKTRLELPVQTAFHPSVTGDTGAMVAGILALMCIAVIGGGTKRKRIRP